MKEITFNGFDHSSGGYWKCTLQIPDGWKEVKKGKVNALDKCMTLIIPEKTLRWGKEHNLKGRWENIVLMSSANEVKFFRAVIRKNKKE